jgi:uncharacterized membrane protein HdeD (DUF308 family)
MSIPQSQDEFRDALRLEARGLARRAINGVRLTFGIAGAVAVIVGVLLLVWPQHTIPLLAFLFGIYLIVAGGVRLALGIFGSSLGTGPRVLSVLLGTLLVIGGAIALRDTAAASATLLLVVAIVVGVGWIVEGIMAITESGASPRQGWSVAYGVISVLGGVAVLAVPGWSGFWLLMVAAIILIVLGLLGLMRAVTFGRDVKAAL